MTKMRCSWMLEISHAIGLDLCIRFWHRFTHVLPVTFMGSFFFFSFSFSITYAGISFLLRISFLKAWKLVATILFPLLFLHWLAVPFTLRFFILCFEDPVPSLEYCVLKSFFFFFFSSVLIFLYLCICFRVYLFNTLFSHLSPVILLVGMVCRGIILCFYFDWLCEFLQGRLATEQERRRRFNSPVI